MELIRAENVRKWFPLRGGFLERRPRYVHAVDDITFAIQNQEIFGLAGESGCGKTTASKLLVRLVEPTSGEIYLDGTDISHLEGRELREFRKNVQMVFQDPYESLNPRFNIYDTIAEPLIVQRIGSPEEQEEMVYKALETVELRPAEDFVFRFPHELSGGQRQRVAVARALVIEPTFIVADEPVSMLDVSIRAGVMNLMLELREKFGLTFVFVTHDLAVSRYMCDHIAIMYLGKVVEIAATEELVRNPHHPYTKALLSAVPVPDPTEKRKRIDIIGGVSAAVDPPPGCRFASRCPYAIAKCKREDPVLKDVDKDHLAACYLA
ncbi:MAG: ABC transporter ATP-binding protein [Theionarchaea archaeon]|nr:MAG: oligopeptide ABC transporter ATP-binding protein [Theionarchaea archaeon DG-70-1]MBU7025916.1 ABC transporter ATP-binding protein [Theionarchaea archaeon]